MSLYCSIPDCENLPERNCICASHNIAARKAERKALEPQKKRKAINQVSEKKSKEVSKYSKLKEEFIKGKECPVYPHLPVVDIHHMAGKVGDLFLDTRYWLAVSRKGHIKIELNPKWAREMGYSLQRQ